MTDQPPLPSPVTRSGRPAASLAISIGVVTVAVGARLLAARASFASFGSPGLLGWAGYALVLLGLAVFASGLASLVLRASGRMQQAFFRDDQVLARWTCSLAEWQAVREESRRLPRASNTLSVPLGVAIVAGFLGMAVAVASPGARIVVMGGAGVIAVLAGSHAWTRRRVRQRRSGVDVVLARGGASVDAEIFQWLSGARLDRAEWVDGPAGAALALTITGNIVTPETDDVAIAITGQRTSMEHMERDRHGNVTVDLDQPAQSTILIPVARGSEAAARAALAVLQA